MVQLDLKLRESEARVEVCEEQVKTGLAKFGNLFKGYEQIKTCEQELMGDDDEVFESSEGVLQDNVEKHPQELVDGNVVDPQDGVG